jgi:hypothetical protein
MKEVRSPGFKSRRVNVDGQSVTPYTNTMAWHAPKPSKRSETMYAVGPSDRFIHEVTHERAGFPADLAI